MGSACASVFGALQLLNDRRQHSCLDVSCSDGARERGLGKQKWGDSGRVGMFALFAFIVLHPRNPKIFMG